MKLFGPKVDIIALHQFGTFIFIPSWKAVRFNCRKKVNKLWDAVIADKMWLKKNICAFFLTIYFKKTSSFKKKMWQMWV